MARSVATKRSRAGAEAFGVEPSGHSKDFRVPVPPVRVLLFDQRQLSRTRSGLDLLLAVDGVRHRREHLDSDEQAAAVPRAEAGNEAFSLFPDAAPALRGGSRIDRKSTRLNSSHYC